MFLYGQGMCMFIVYKSISDYTVKKYLSEDKMLAFKYQSLVGKWGII